MSNTDRISITDDGIEVNPEQAEHVLTPDSQGMIQRAICWVNGHSWNGHWFTPLKDEYEQPAISCRVCGELRVFHDPETGEYADE